MTTAHTMTKEPKTEAAKRASRFLRGTLAETLAAGADAFAEEDVSVLKFHGIYQQDDRDARRARRATGRPKEHWFMVRCAIPGGRLTAAQYLALDRLAEQVTYNRSLRVTTRQGLQFHGVIAGYVRPALREVNEALVTTLAACGDVERNVMASPAPIAGAAHAAVQELAAEIARELRPRTRAYHEIWLDGVRFSPEADEDEEPFYGPTYLPRKFKTAVGLPTDASLDLAAQDVGLLAVMDGDRVAGVNVLAGGGQGMTHKKPDTFARLATPLGYVAREHAVAVVREIAAIFRDHGNRGDRRHARLKYLLEAWGVERFRAELEARLGVPLEPWLDVDPPAHQEAPQDLMGRHPQGDGRYFYGLPVPNGRIADELHCRRKTALARLVETLGPRVIFTPDQNVLLADLEERDLQTLDTIFAAYDVPRAESVPRLRRYALACPALPTCGLALTEAERVFPRVLDGLEAELAAHGLEDEPLAVRMVGCPNGCARPYTADIGLVGRGILEYDVYVGGGLAGDRLGDLFAEQVPVDAVARTLAPLVRHWAAERRGDETLGAYYQRAFGTGERRTLLTGGKDDQPWVLRLPRRLQRGLARLAREGHPHEVCALLLGVRLGRSTRVQRYAPSANLAEERRTRYVLDPRDYVAADQAARREGLEIVGFWHTHPDHPAVPSPTDREAAWEGVSYVIQAVTAAAADDLRSWRLHGDRFIEERLVLDELDPSKET